METRFIIFAAISDVCQASMEDAVSTICDGMTFNSNNSYIDWVIDTWNRNKAKQSFKNND